MALRSKTTVLIVDDSRLFRAAVQACLSPQKDLEVIGAVGDGQKALECIAERRPDIVTLDVEMPVMNGLETLKAIEEINAKTPDQRSIGAIMLSSFTREGADITIEALGAGAFDFITKPTANDLEGGIEKLRRELTIKIRTWVTKVTVAEFKARRGVVPRLPVPRARPSRPRLESGGPIAAILIACRPAVRAP